MPTQEIAVQATLIMGGSSASHLIRGNVERTRDVGLAAEMLGDTVAVVMQTYYHVIAKDQHAKAKAFLGTALHTG